MEAVCQLHRVISWGHMMRNWNNASDTFVVLVRWQENLTLRRCGVDHHSPSPPGRIPHHTSTHNNSLVNIHQRSSATINDHQRPSTTINDHQRPSTTINDHQRPSTTINDHQRPSTIINTSATHQNTHPFIRSTP
ncbi:hypothetical protein N7455_004238 [Penicillium solitum]|uniref:uncharacterized protein n=1 Tax=Penicillium solitum TaxID=60172 RepID=UPI0032C49437|nr:hypothetical protein N7455_004238 [Penicillium solitum]